MSAIETLINNPQILALRKKLHFVRLKPFDVSTPEGRNSERHRRIALSSGASVMAKIVSISTGLISIPLTLHYLGSERYGIWLIIVSFSSLFSFADLGMGNGVLNQVSHAYGRDDKETIRKVISSGYGALGAIALLVLLVFSLAYPFVPWYKVFNVESISAQAEAGSAIAAFVICFALAIPLGIVQKVQMGLQLSFLSNLWQCASSLMGLAGVLLVITFHGDLTLLVFALMGAPLIMSFSNSIIFFKKVMPNISPKISLMSASVIHSISKTGALFIVLQIVGSITYSSDGLIIAQTLGISFVPQFSVPERLFAVVGTVIQMLLAPLWPAFGEAFVIKDYSWVQKTLKRSTKVAVAAAFSGSLLLIAFFPFIMRVWVHNEVNPPFMLILGFGIWKIIEAAGNCFAVFFNGINAIGFQVIISCLTCLSALILKIIFIHAFGVTGTIWATIISFSLLALIPSILRGRKLLEGKIGGS